MRSHDGARALPWVALTCAAVLVGATGCMPLESEESQVRFALLSGDVALSTDNEATLPLVVVAPADDPVWSGVHELHVTNDAGGGDLVLAGGSARVELGSEVDGIQMGTISVDIPDDLDEFAVSSVRIAVEEGDELVSHDIGEWSFERVDSTVNASASDDNPGAVSQCGEIGFDVQSDVASNADVVSVETGAPGMTIDDLQVSPRAAGGSHVTFELDCDGDYDFYVFSPRVAFEVDGALTHRSLLPISVGYMDISAEDVSRIMRRDTP